MGSGAGDRPYEVIVELWGVKDRGGAVGEAAPISVTLGAHAVGRHHDPLDPEAIGDRGVGRRLTEVDVEHAQAQPASEVIVRRDVDLVAHRLRAADGGQEPQLGQFGERRVDRPAPDLGHRRAGAGVHLVGGQVLGVTVMEGAENRAALRSHAQPALAQQVGWVPSHVIQATTGLGEAVTLGRPGEPMPGDAVDCILVRTMSELMHEPC